MDRKPRPVILDTDIGGDIDDMWALSLLLKSPELDLKLAVSVSGNSEPSAQVIAQALDRAGRTDVPVGIGMHLNDNPTVYCSWAQDYDFTKYPGKVFKDGIGALIDTIMASDEEITVIEIGPAINLAAALEREPRIAEKARIIAMAGSICKGYGHIKGMPVAAECNVLVDIPAWQKVLSASWPVEITPLDTCGDVVLRDDRFARIRANTKDPIIDGLMACLTLHAQYGKYPFWQIRSTTLYDVVAVYMAITHDNLVFKTLPIAVDGKGYTRVVPGAKNVECALDWVDVEKFYDFITDRYLS